MKRRTKKILQKFAGQKIHLQSKGANFFGQESKKLKQIRGNGILLLTDDELYFEMFIPKKVLAIPLRDVLSLEIVKSHLGKFVGRPLFKINFTNTECSSDSAAFWVRDPQKWKEVVGSYLVKKKRE